MDEIVNVEAAEPATDTELRSVAAIVEQELAAQRRLVLAEIELKTAKAELRAIEYDRLPAALEAVGYQAPSRGLVINGHQVEFKEIFRCGQLQYPPPLRDEGDSDVPRARDPLAALAWLEERGHGDLEKRQIVVTMGRDSEDTARRLLHLIATDPAANQLEVAHRRVVLWNTLQKFAREQTEQGSFIAEEERTGLNPLALLGVMVEKRALVKEPKNG